MLRRKKNTRAQSIAEYVVLIGVVSLALIMGMQVYMKRGIQAVIKTSADEMGSQKDTETDPDKGAKMNSTLHRVVTGAGAKEATENLPQGVSQRVRAYEGGSQRSDFATTSTVTGNTTYESTRDE